MVRVSSSLTIAFSHLLPFRRFFCFWPSPCLPLYFSKWFLSLFLSWTHAFLQFQVIPFNYFFFFFFIHFPTSSLFSLSLSFPLPFHKLISLSPFPFPLSISPSTHLNLYPYASLFKYFVLTLLFRKFADWKIHLCYLFQCLLTYGYIWFSLRTVGSLFNYYFSFLIWRHFLYFSIFMNERRNG